MTFDPASDAGAESRTSLPGLRPVLVTHPNVETLHDRWLQIPTSSGWWLVDLQASSLCRTEQSHDPRFVPADHWQPFSRVHVGEERVEAELRSGERISALVLAA